ncbi:MAG: hypothetical protein QM765_30445 [Myxococcales bacterium]
MFSKREFLIVTCAEKFMVEMAPPSPLVCRASLSLKTQLSTLRTPP